jgi:hypothetical protein
VDPFSHSFVSFGSAKGAELYYTGIARMTSLDNDISLQCWTLHMATIEGPWIWIIDCANMELHHNISKGFVSIFTDMLLKEQSRLRRIVVLNPNVWFYGVMHALSKSIPPVLLDSVWYVDRGDELNRVRSVLDIPCEAMSWLRVARTVNPNIRLEDPAEMLNV